MNGSQLFALAIFGIGLALQLFARRLNRPLEEYEFRNRTDGGVIKFDSLQTSKKHGRKKLLVELIGGVSMLIMAFGGFFFIMFIPFK